MPPRRRRRPARRLPGCLFAVLRIRQRYQPVSVFPSGRAPMAALSPGVVVARRPALAATTAENELAVARAVEHGYIAAILPC